MAGEPGWWDTANRYLRGRNFGDHYALRPVPIARKRLDAARMRSLRGSTLARLYNCGPKPWPDRIHAAVAILRGYYVREMGGEFDMGYVGEVPTYLILTGEDERTGWAAGILCFNHFGPDRFPIDDGHCFMFAWVHPLFRRKGLMQSAVKLVAADLGQFYCQTPISRGMREILRKMGHPQAEDMTGMEIHGHHYR
jgi:hypothetical protein